MRLPTVKPSGFSRTVRVRLYESPRADIRAAAKLVNDTSKVKPRELAVFDVSVPRGTDPRAAVEEAVKKRGYTEIRALTQSTREFLVYIPHPNDKRTV